MRTFLIEKKVKHIWLFMPNGTFFLHWATPVHMRIVRFIWWSVKSVVLPIPTVLFSFFFSISVTFENICRKIRQQFKILLSQNYPHRQIKLLLLFFFGGTFLFNRNIKSQTDIYFAALCNFWKFQMETKKMKNICFERKEKNRRENFSTEREKFIFGAK